MIRGLLAGGAALFGALLLTTQPKGTRPHLLGVVLVAFAGSTAVSLLF